MNSLNIYRWKICCKRSNHSKKIIENNNQNYRIALFFHFTFTNFNVFFFCLYSISYRGLVSIQFFLCSLFPQETASYHKCTCDDSRIKTRVRRTINRNQRRQQQKKKNNATYLIAFISLPIATIDLLIWKKKWVEQPKLCAWKV